MIRQSDLISAPPKDYNMFKQQPLAGVKRKA